MTLSVTLDSSVVPLPEGWQYSSEDPPSASWQIRLPREGRTEKYDGAVFTFALLRLPDQDVVLINLHEPAAFLLDDEGEGTVHVRFDNELDVSFRATSTNDGQSVVIVASNHLIALLTVSSVFEVGIYLTDLRVDIEADFGGPVNWSIR